MFYLTTHSTHFIYGYMVKDHSDSEKGNPLPPHRLLYRLTARVLLYAPSHRQDSTYHSLCYTSRGALMKREIAQLLLQMQRNNSIAFSEKKTLTNQSTYLKLGRVTSILLADWNT